MRRERTRHKQIEQSSELKIDDDEGLHDGPTPPHDPLGKAQS